MQSMRGEAPHWGLLLTRHTISSRAEQQKTIIQQLVHLKAAQASMDWGQPQALCCGFKLFLCITLIGSYKMSLGLLPSNQLTEPNTFQVT